MDHGLGSIVVANGNFSSESQQTKVVPRNKKRRWSTIDFNEGTQIREYIAPDKAALKENLLCPVVQLGWLHELKIYQLNTRKIFCHNATNNQLTCHRYDSSSFIAVFCC